MRKARPDKHSLPAQFTIKEGGEVAVSIMPAAVWAAVVTAGGYYFVS
jgi:hypothetical protein